MKSTENVINLDNILFNCRDILRAARNSGSFFEKNISLHFFHLQAIHYRHDR